MLTTHGAATSRSPLAMVEGAARGIAARSPVAWSHLGIAAAILVGLLATLHVSPPIANRGEAREGLIVRTIVREGEWVLPRREGLLASKPPLFHWIAAAIALPLGLSDAAVRTPSVLAAWIVLLSTFAIGRSVGEQRVAWLATAALLGTVGFWRSALEARVDMVFTACVCVSLAAFYRWYLDRGRVARALVYLGGAAAVLAKGPVGAVLPALVIGGFLLARRDGAALRRLWAPWPALGAAVLVLGWYALAYQRGGNEFVAVHVFRENVDRFVGREGFEGRRAHRPLKLLGEFAVHLFPWNLALFFALRRRREGGGPDVAGRFLHVWWLVVLGFFSLAGGKRGVYLLPLYPAIALLAARELVARIPPRLIPASAGAITLLAVAAAGWHLANGWSAAREESLLSFARLVDVQLPRSAPLGATGAVAENDVLILAYAIDRPLPRIRTGDRRPPFLIAPAGARGPLTAGCSVAIDPVADQRPVVLLQCPER